VKKAQIENDTTIVEISLLSKFHKNATISSGVILLKPSTNQSAGIYLNMREKSPAFEHDLKNVEKCLLSKFHQNETISS